MGTGMFSCWGQRSGSACAQSAVIPSSTTSAQQDGSRLTPRTWLQPQLHPNRRSPQPEVLSYDPLCCWGRNLGEDMALPAIGDPVAPPLAPSSPSLSVEGPWGVSQ